MRDFALDAEVEELCAAADRLGRSTLAPAVRDHEDAGAWPASVTDVLDGFPLGGLDLPESLGGVDAGCLTKVVVLETLALHDAAGLAAADRTGPTVGALAACPDRALAAQVAASLLAGEACTAFTVPDDELGSTELFWGPSNPPLRWIWTCEGSELALLEVTGPVTPAKVLAFQASGGVAVPFASTTERGRWDIGAHAALAVRGRARLWGAAIAVGVAEAALQETLQYTTDRVVFGKPVAHHQGNAFDLAFAASRVHASRLVVRDAAASFDRGEPDAGFWATQAWLETMENAFLVTDIGIQLLGGHGFIVDHLAEKRFRECRHLAMLAGALDAAEADVAAVVLDVPDALLAGLEQQR